MKTEANERAVVGNNNPPPDEFDLVSGEITDLYTEAGGWADGEPIKTQGQADSVEKLVKMIKAAARRAEEHRKEMVLPIDEAKAEIQEKFNPLIGKVKADGSCGKTVRAIDVLNKILTPWKNKLQAEKEVRAKEVRKIAEEKMRAAQDAMRHTKNLEKREQAEVMLREAEKARAAAKRAAKDNVKGMRTVWAVSLIDPQAALRHYYRVRPNDLVAFARKLAEEDVRAGARSIPGCEITNKKIAK